MDGLDLFWRVEILHFTQGDVMIISRFPERTPGADIDVRETAQSGRILYYMWICEVTICNRGFDKLSHRQAQPPANRRQLSLS